MIYVIISYSGFSGFSLRGINVRILFDTITILFILFDVWYLGAMQNINISGALSSVGTISFVYYLQGTKVTKFNHNITPQESRGDQVAGLDLFSVITK